MRSLLHRLPHFIHFYTLICCRSALGSFAFLSKEEVTSLGGCETVWRPGDLGAGPGRDQSWRAQGLEALQDARGRAGQAWDPRRLRPCFGSTAGSTPRSKVPPRDSDPAPQLIPALRPRPGIKPRPPRRRSCPVAEPRPPGSTSPAQAQPHPGQAGDLSLAPHRPRWHRSAPP